MNETLKTEHNIREYLLGRVKDDAKLAQYEELLFSDDEFCSLAEITEDSLINDYVFGRLTASDEADFVRTLENNGERRGKIALTRAIKEKAAQQPATANEQQPSLFDSIKAFLRQPIYAGGIALLLIAVLVGSLFLLRSSPDELANLKDIYKKERPVEPRITGFDHAPLVVTRGAADDANKNKLELEKTRFLQAVVENPTAPNFHKLGVFYLTQQNYKDAIENLEKAVKLDDKNTAFQNDLGTAYFEFAKQSRDDKLLNLSRANEAFSAALKLNSDSLEALFNRSLVLQEMGLRNQASESWNLYLQKDPSSKWADEARKNLERIKQVESGSTKTKEQVLDEFLMAYRGKDWQFAEKIHNSTKGMLNGISPFEQLTRRYLEARRARDALTERESLDAMKYIGNLEKEKHADFFYAELAEFYAQVDLARLDDLFKARDLLNEGSDLFPKSKFNEAIAKFEESKRIFEQNSNQTEATLAEVLIGEALPDAGKLVEGKARLERIIEVTEEKNYLRLSTVAHYWIAVIHYRQSQLSRSNRSLQRALLIAENTNNVVEVEHSAEFLALNHDDLGDTERAFNYLGKTTINAESFYQNSRQVWRNLTSIADASNKLGHYVTSIEFAKEAVTLSKKFLSESEAVNLSLNLLAKAFVNENNFEMALLTADESNGIAINKGITDINTKTIADTFYWRGDIKRQISQCVGALADYDKSIEYYAAIPQTTYNLYKIHQGKLVCFQTLGRQIEFDKELQTVLNLSEQHRQSIKEDDLRQSFFESQQHVYDAAIINSLNKNDKEKAFEYAETSKARSLLDFVRSKKSIADVEKDFGSVARSLTLTEIQEGIPENVQVVEYALINDRLAIWTITKNRFDLTEKPVESEALAQKITDYREAIINNTDAESVKNLARELYESFLPQDLESGKILCLIPDKSLHQVPFASLISPTGRYLIEDHDLLYSPSASVLVVASENAQARGHLDENILSIGDPRFDSEENPKLKDLPEAEIEAMRIADNYSRSSRFIGSDATKSKFLDNLQVSSIIHFAGHFVANERSSSNSKMPFADGDLRVFELADKKLTRTKLVVLSACETGIERTNKSEGAIGIARTFLAMGTPIVVASNWKVDSEATKDLMIAFHKNRRVEKLSTSAALRQAQLDMIKTGNFSAPFYWAAFSATGGLTNY